MPYAGAQVRRMDFFTIRFVDSWALGSREGALSTLAAALQRRWKAKPEGPASSGGYADQQNLIVRGFRELRSITSSQSLWAFCIQGSGL